MQHKQPKMLHYSLGNPSVDGLPGKMCALRGLRQFNAWLQLLLRPSCVRACSLHAYA
jgi:hypothetical protein